MMHAKNEIDFSLKKFLNQNATHGERNFAIVRICLTIMLFSQMVVFTGSLKELAEGSLKYWLITLGVLVAIIFSIAVLILLKPHHESTALRLWSIAIDAVVMFLILFPSTLWPSVRYNGFLSRMDAAILIFVIIGTCFRLKKRGILIGGV